MYLALHDLALRTRRLDGLLDGLLSAFIGDDFCRFADCGAGIGYTGAQYAGLIRDGFNGSPPKRARVVCFEPLPENVEQLRAALQLDPLVEIQAAAVSNKSGTANFYVPHRFAADSVGGWAKNTSYDGFLAEGVSGDTVQVPTVRLQDVGDEPFDFIKLDLQGGEPSALEGLGSQIGAVKILYSEQQLLKENNVVEFYQENSFSVFYDKLQFGVKPGNLHVHLEAFRKAGIEISSFYLPSEGGLPFILWGHFNTTIRMPLDGHGRLKADVRAALLAAGVTYLQTDILAVSPQKMGAFARHIGDLG